MNTIYFDWSHRRGVYALFDNTDEGHIYPSLDIMLDALKEPHTIIGEATFESFDLARRQAVIERCEKEGHDLFTVPNRLTGRNRRLMLDGADTKNDAIDTQAIRWEVERGVSLKRPSMVHTNSAAREQVASRMVHLRSTGTLSPRPRSLGYNFTSAKDLYAQGLAAQLPAYADQPATRQVALGDGKAYNNVVVAAVGVVAEYAKTRKEFESLAGLHAHGYPCQVRADLHHYAWAGGNTRAKLNEMKKRDDITMSQWRKELRWLFQQLRTIHAGTAAPE